MKTIRRIWQYRKEVVVADHRIDILSLAMWFLMGTWGILSTVQQVTILNQAIDWYPIVWGSLIGVLALVAFIGCMMIFVVLPTDYNARIRWKRLELAAVSCLVCVAGVYPGLMVIDLFGDTPRPDLTALSLTYLLVPIWRIGHLRSRIQNLEAVRDKQND